MVRTPHRLAIGLTALLVLSVLNSVWVPTSVLSTQETTTENPTLASARSATAEVFLTSGGSSTHNEVNGVISGGDFGYVVGGQVNSSASSVDFGPHNYTPSSPYSNGNEFYLASLDDFGTWNFVVGADHSQGGVSYISDVASFAGNPIVAGYMYGPVGFGQTQLASVVQFDAFIAQTDVTGNWLWATGFQTFANATTDRSIPQAIAVDQMGDIIVAGYFSGETDFGGTTLNASDNEIFVAKLNGVNGNLKWVVSSTGIGNQSVTDVVVDVNGDIHVSATTQNTVRFGTNAYNVVGTTDSFIAKISSAGTFQAFTGYGISGQTVILSEMALGPGGDLYVAGSFQGTMAKNGWSITANKGGTDLFFVREGATTNSQWALVGGTNTDDSLGGMDVTSKGDIVFMSPRIASTFTGGTKGVTPTSSSWSGPYGDADTLMGGINSNGGWSWLDVTASPSWEIGMGLATNASDVATVIGSFWEYGNPATISKGTNSVTSTGGWDNFVWALDPSMKADKDNDGVPDMTDNCPNDSNPAQGNTDGDEFGDACDPDDDNDGITDNSPDDCPRNSAANWASTQDFDDPANSSDWDRDGCKDDAEDNDIDNDGVENSADLCPRSPYQPPRPTWVSDSVTDADGDGCRDSDEDTDDDGDGIADVSDDCPTVAGTSTLGEEGCPDDDGDGWSNNLDDCPTESGNSSLGGKNACPDNDGDGWANVDDAFSEDPTQWLDGDGDGFGDNADGTSPDSCPSVSGTSTVDRNGCLDTDGDGVSDPDAVWSTESGADAFVDDPTQWSDFDGDGYGDNYANASWEDRNPSWPGELREDVMTQDACPTQEGTSWQNGMIGCPDQDGDGWYNLQDAFPNDPTQWSDIDADGYGDNASGNNPDSCPEVLGTSTEDRFGCVDTDDDGYSDPDFDTNWLPANGADAFPNDPTQWSDADGDFYGDNPEGEQPDACPDTKGTSRLDRLGCFDSDGDGYSDPSTAWTLDQGADACVLIYGTSTADRTGCLDSDGDNYSDPTDDFGVADGADAYPDDPSRWILEEDEKGTGLGSSTSLMIGGGAVAVGLLAVVGFVLTRRGRSDETQLEALGGPAASTYGMAASTVAMPDFSAQPNVATAVQTPQASPPPAQPDPAKEYYNSLLAQGYPAEDAMRYTQQYFQQFRG